MDRSLQTLGTLSPIFSPTKTRGETSVVAGKTAQLGLTGGEVAVGGGGGNVAGWGTGRSSCAHTPVMATDPPAASCPSGLQWLSAGCQRTTSSAP